MTCISSLSETELKTILKSNNREYLSFRKENFTIKIYTTPGPDYYIRYEVTYFLDNNDFVSEIWTTDQIKSELYKFKVERLLK